MHIPALMYTFMAGQKCTC